MLNKKYRRGRTKGETLKAFSLSALLLFSFLILTSTVSAVITGTEWKVVKHDGIEKDLYSISKLKGNEVCISMKNKDLSSISKGKEKVEYPSKINLYQGKDKMLKESRVLTAKNKISFKKNEECFQLDSKKSSYYQIGENSIIIALTNFYSIYSDYFQGWEYTITGNESVLWDVGTLNNTHICIEPNNTNLEDVEVEECETWVGEDCTKWKTIKYKYPNKIKIKDKDGGEKQEVDLEVGTSQYCFDLDYNDELWYKIGDESIIIFPTTTYDSQGTNITQQNQFAHLNLTDPDLVLYMPFDVNSSGTTYDYSNNSNDGTLNGGVTFNSTGGIYGGAYEFDGVDDYVEVANSASLIFGTSNFSFSLFFKDRVSVTEDYLFGLGGLGAGNTVGITLGSTGRIRARPFGVASKYTVEGYDDEEWHSAVYVVNRNQNATLFIDGAEVLTQDISASSATSLGTYSWFIGAESGSAGYFNGSIDEVMIFNRSLTTTEIQQIYNSTYSRFYPTGEMIFENLNFGTNNTLNISIPDCQQYNGSQLSLSFNDGSFENLDSNCQANSYSIDGDLTSANLTLRFNSGSYQFYSPILYGNITLDDYFKGAVPVTPSPFTGTRNCFAYNYIKPVGNCTR